MINAKEAKKFLCFPKNRFETIEKKIKINALNGCRVVLFSKDEFGNNEEEIDKTMKLLKKNGFNITPSMFDEDDVYINF